MQTGSMTTLARLVRSMGLLEQLTGLDTDEDRRKLLAAHTRLTTLEQQQVLTALAELEAVPPARQQQQLLEQVAEFEREQLRQKTTRTGGTHHV